MLLIASQANLDIVGMELFEHSQIYKAVPSLHLIVQLIKLALNDAFLIDS
jgi:hypothetical protein